MSPSGHANSVKRTRGLISALAPIFVATPEPDEALLHVACLGALQPAVPSAALGLLLPTFEPLCKV